MNENICPYVQIGDVVKYQKFHPIAARIGELVTMSSRVVEIWPAIDCFGSCPAWYKLAGLKLENGDLIDPRNTGKALCLDCPVGNLKLKPDRIDKLIELSEEILALLKENYNE